MHFGFQATGAHFLDFADIHLEHGERSEDLYQRLKAFVEDNLLRKNDIRHHGEQLTEDEELTPTLENFVVLTWLPLIHSDLPKLVKQGYETKLRLLKLASMKPEISQTLRSLLDEIRTAEDAKLMRTATSPLRRLPLNAKAPIRFHPRAKSCPLCKQAGHADSHYLSECTYLPENDRRYIAKARQIAGILWYDDSDTDDDPPVSHPEPAESQPVSSALPIQVRQSPYLDTFYRHHPVRITIDSSATGNMIRLSTVQKLGAEIRKSAQSAHQADGSSPLKVVGKTRISVPRDSHVFQFEGLILKNLDVEVHAGTPLMEVNDIAVRPPKRLITLGDGTSYLIRLPRCGPPCPSAFNNHLAWGVR